MLKDNEKASAYYCVASAYAKINSFEFLVSDSEHYRTVWKEEIDFTNPYLNMFRNFSEKYFDEYFSNCTF